jgi:hypothetical protein
LLATKDLCTEVMKQEYVLDIRVILGRYFDEITSGYQNLVSAYKFDLSTIDLRKRNLAGMWLIVCCRLVLTHLLLAGVCG